MPAKYAKSTNISKNLISLYSSQFEVFLEIFWDFFIFWNSNLKFEFDPVSNRPDPEPGRAWPVRPVTAVTGPVRSGFFNPVEE